MGLERGGAGASLCAGIALLATGVAYYFLTEDTADGDYSKLREEGTLASSSARLRALSWTSAAIPVFGHSRFCMPRPSVSN
jgi:hypothetical protein